MNCRHIVWLLFFLASTATAQMRWNSAYQQYINQYKDLAIEQMKKYKVPASITLAQGLFESRAGMSDMARNANNHFGIKCHNSWKGATVRHNDDAANECFRSYDNVYESFEDHSRFLATGTRYKSLFDLKTTDYKGWAYGLKKAGYATNPKYADKLIEIIQLYKLYDYDKAKTYDRFYARHSRDMAVDGDLHPIFTFNKNYYVKARRGDTFKSLGKEIGISYKKLAKYNERSANDKLAEGEYIYLKKKQRKAPKDYRGRLHYARAGQSMYSIAQLYGIRLKSLYKINGLSPDYQLKVGDGLKVR